MNSSVMTRLLSLNAGFVDTVGFLGLQGLFAAHVTGNFVTLAAAFVYGSQGAIGKILALPEFIGAVAVARLVGTTLTARGMPTLTILLGVEARFSGGFPRPRSGLRPVSEQRRPAGSRGRLRRDHGHGTSKRNAARALSGRTADRDNDE